MLPLERSADWADSLHIVRVVLTRAEWGGPNGFVDDVAVAIVEWQYSANDHSEYFLTAIPITQLSSNGEPEEYIEVIPDAIIEVIVGGCVAVAIAYATCQAKIAQCLTEVDENLTTCEDSCRSS